MGIDDVPVMALTLWTDDPQRGATELAEVAHTLETELKRVPGTRDVYTIGAPERVVVVNSTPTRLAAYDLSVADLAQRLAGGQRGSPGRRTRRRRPGGAGYRRHLPGRCRVRCRAW